MKKFLPLVMLLMTGAVVAPARADLTHRMTSSTQLQVNGAYTDATRIGSTYTCLLYTSPSPRDRQKSRMPSSA